MENFEIAKKISKYAMELDELPQKLDLPTPLLEKLVAIIVNLHDTAEMFAGNRVDEIYAPDEPVTQRSLVMKFEVIEEDHTI